MTRRRKTDGERLARLAIDNWPDEIWIAKRIDRIEEALRYPSHSEEYLRHMRIATQYEQEAERGGTER